MLPVIRRSAGQLSCKGTRRWLATEVALPQNVDGKESEESKRQRYEQFLEEKAAEPPLRPQLKVPVNENHGLYAFFRQLPGENGGPEYYETVQNSAQPSSKMGRSWNAVELRRKSFQDLHTIWYLALRERNLLATQKAEARRIGVIPEFLDVQEKDAKCRKTMARIKQILNERRIAYEQAHALAYEETLQSRTEVSREEPKTNVASSATRGRRLRRTGQAQTTAS